MPTDRGANLSQLLQRFPVLERLFERATQKRVPYVGQLTATECGAACLAMVLGYFGKDVSLEELRQHVHAGRDGVSALQLADQARRFGLRGRALRLEIEDLRFMNTPGAILHWDFDHFVVLQRAREDYVDIVDPARGPRRVPMTQFRRSFTGIALVFEPTKDFQPQRAAGGYVRRYIGTLLRGSGLLPRIVITSVLVQLFGLLLPALTGVVVDQVVPRDDEHLLTIIAVGAGIVVVFSYLATLIRSFLLLHFRTLLDAKMTLEFFEHMVDLPYAFFQTRTAGDLMMRLNSNSTIREILTSGALSGVLDGSLVLVYLVILVAMSPPMAALALVVAAAQVAVYLVRRRRRRDLASLGLETQSRSRNYQIQLLQGIETLKAMGIEQRAVEKWAGLFVDELNASVAAGKNEASINALLSGLRLLGPLAILCFGASQVIHNQLSLGMMLSLNALATGFLSPLNTLVGTAAQFQLAETHIRRAEDIMRAAPEQDPQQQRRSPRLTGAIRLERVAFGYQPTAPLVVRDVSLEVAPGAQVAIVGRSGAGKSTLASLLIGLYRPSSGRIVFDSTDLAELDLRSLRRQVGIVTQRPFLFGGTIRENIAIGNPDMSLEQVIAAARLAQVHDDIAAMPLGYDTVLVDAGASLSGGQRQRLALARALATNPSILVLDEATSALDAITESNVQTALAQLRCTRIIIAHRLSTVRASDLILVLDRGVIVEYGTHEELVGAGGHYARLLASQLG